jgi:predicted MFS family arabinose efflux permease
MLPRCRLWVMVLPQSKAQSETIVAATIQTPAPLAADPALSPQQRARGRRLAIASHPAGMTFRIVFTEQLPTLALVALGASETIVGLQRALEPVGQMLQLPTLRLVGRLRMRTILVAGQLLAVLGALPLVAFAALAAFPVPWAQGIALASLAVAAIGIVVSQTVWFPLLRGYVEPERTGQFFGTLRSLWHLVLIGYFLGAQRWLAAAPGAYGFLFGIGVACGLARVLLVMRLPEAGGGGGERLRIRDAFAALRHNESLPLYLLGVCLAGASRRAVVPFVIVLMRRFLGLSDTDVLLTTVAYFAGGFVSLYLWGRIVDRVGPVPVFAGTAVATAALYAGLIIVPPGPLAAPLMIGVFFVLAVLSSGFGVADTHVLFSLAPARAPAPVLVIADVIASLTFGLVPLIAGVLLDSAGRAGLDPVASYSALFLAAAAAALAAPLPLRRFRNAKAGTTKAGT